MSNLNHNYSNEVAYGAGSDASHYLVIGKNIADFNVYSDTNSAIVSESATWRPPFWPFILSLFLRITTSPLAIIIIKSILEAFLLGYILLKFKKDTAVNFLCLLPFCLLFIEPQYLKYSIAFLSESLTAILILILTIFFISTNNAKRCHIAIPFLLALIVLCHPVSAFFVGSLGLIYFIYNFNFNRNKVIFHCLLFLFILLSWPCRNAITFRKGFYLTASQGTTLAKGWNEKVAAEFTNSKGDLADEGLNLKYVDPKLIERSQNSVLDLSHLYTIGTKKFINGIGAAEIMKIALKKLKSNFNPFPESPKPGVLETLSIGFRIIYLFVFIQMIVRFCRKRKIDFNTINDRIYLVVLAIFMGQSIMAVYIYTGLRFNTIYSLSLLFCFLYLNTDFLRNRLNKKQIHSKK
ncbi:hypothetical protein [Flavobacterium seoulense]|uniref:hypothetical protein n=1 Tax=Flavobacterium seoulense TaxID=1492738 RepID=UPI000552DD9B|nr:hypothetical protein [Flavobacterium seoulense]